MTTNHRTIPGSHVVPGLKLEDGTVGSGRNGERLLVYNDALYRAFKNTLLNRRCPLISNGDDDIAFLRKQEKSLERHPNPKFANWVYWNNIDFHRIRREHISGINVSGYSTTVKFIPPITRTTLEKLLERFKKEFELKDARRQSCDRTYSRVAIQDVPADGKNFPGSIQTTKIQIPEPEFEKIRPHIIQPEQGQSP